MTDRPGVALDSGFTFDDDQEQHRENTREVQRKIAPMIESVRIARLRAREEANNYVVG